MKKVLKKIGVLLLLTLPIAMYAQEQEEIIRDDSGKAVLVRKGEDAWLIGDIWDNWFFGANVGIHSFIGNEAKGKNRFNGIQPDINVEIGKWLTPSFGFSINVDGFYAKGQSNYGNVPYIVHDGEFHKFTFYYLITNGQVKLDLVNLFGGYSRGRKAQIHPQLVMGLGFAWQTGKDVNNLKVKPNNFELSFVAGIENDIRFSKAFSFSQTLKIIGMRGSWDYSPQDNYWNLSNARNRYDLMPSLTVGIKIHLIPKAKHMFLKGVHDTVYLEQVAENIALREFIVIKEKEIDSLEKTTEEVTEALAAIPIPVQVLETAARMGIDYTTVFYIIDKYDIDYNGQMKIMAAARKINASKDGVKFLLIGAADEATGTTNRNIFLSNKRCEVVRDMLVNVYGVNPDKLELRPIGEILTYDPVELNRMTIIIENNEEILKILEQDKANRTNNR